MARRRITVSKSGLQHVALGLAREMTRIKKERQATLVFLTGDLGSGKTSFVQVLAKVLRAQGRVLSPTFVFVHEHAIKSRAVWRKLVHMDAYRMERPRDVAAVGIKSYLKDPNNFVIVEWGERIAKWIRRPDAILHFSHKTPSRRTIEINFFNVGTKTRAKN